MLAQAIKRYAARLTGAHSATGGKSGFFALRHLFGA